MRRMKRLNWVLICILLPLILLMYSIVPVESADLNCLDPHHWTPRYILQPPRKFRASLDPAPHVVWLEEMSADELELLEHQFPDWGFAAASPWPGDFDVYQYDVDMDRTLPNHFIVDFVEGDPPPSGWVWQWIQIIITNDPVPAAVAAGKDGFYEDPQPNDDPPGDWSDMPFYWTEDEREIFSAGGAGCPDGVDIRFADRPSRALKEAPVDWIAHLYIAYWDHNNPGQVNICDGIEWGFHIRWTCDTNVGGPHSSAGVAGEQDKFESEMYGIHYDDPAYPIYTPEVVGGFWVPVDKLGLLAPYISLASTILVATVATAIYTKRVKRKKEKQ